LNLSGEDFQINGKFIPLGNEPAGIEFRLGKDFFG